MPMTCKPYKGWTCPLWFSEPVLTRSAMPSVTLSELAPDKKKAVWGRIQQEYPPMADLLKSQEFQQVKQNLERLFGPVSVGVELHRIGGTLYGVRRTTKTDH
ncbi:hypothetical protein L1D15_09880 [Vibrio sp. Isolate25]|uniref:hypothetical protein n=1 Tax=Vibrio sp. Isolate25 TaxID=2908535 RepID=UPI001EFE3B17|nr:hypothetical protein [Vibrio sp. Isolate25]MCG9597034.1 hypothetical protein [Vibrio sp. Isolate25]